LSTRAEELIAASDEPSPGRFHWRRVPGTLALAITNLIGAALLFDITRYAGTPVLFYIHRFGGTAFWGAVFLLSGVFLLAAAVTRRWLPLNLGSFLSLFGWSATSIGVIMTGIIGSTTLSPVAYALAFWMVSGQATMLITPLVARGRGLE